MTLPIIAFYIVVLLWSFYATYWIVFRIFGSKSTHHGGHSGAVVTKHSADHARPQHSSHDGFRAYARGGELTVDDIVKALSRD